MTLQTNSQTRSPADPYFRPFHAYFGSLDTMAQSASPLKSLARCQLEWFGLASRRTQAYLEIPSRLQQCRTPQDLFQEQCRFLQIALEQYAEAGRRIHQAYSEATSSNLAADKPNTHDYISFGQDEAEPQSQPRVNGYDRRRAA